MKKDICLQICSLREGFFEDIVAGLKHVAQMGYTQIELARYSSSGLIGKTPIVDFAKMADDLGLRITGSHIDMPLKDFNAANEQQIVDYWKKAIEHHQSIDLQHLIIPVMPSICSKEQALATCDILNKLGGITKDAGLELGYHNHDLEFYRVVKGGTDSIFGWRNNEGDLIFDLLLDNTDPSLVVFQMDAFWVVMGQRDPIKYLSDYPDRFRLLHIRDNVPFNQSGILNIPRILDEAEKNSIASICVELGRPTDGSDPFDGVEECLRYINMLYTEKALSLEKTNKGYK